MSILDRTFVPVFAAKKKRLNSRSTKIRLFTTQLGFRKRSHTSSIEPGRTKKKERESQTKMTKSKERKRKGVKQREADKQ